jgi:uncharacterized SAM-binding protein YcdF (DUF218 family)/glycosyltransferase involved in cell wall biosynthesis
MLSGRNILCISSIDWDFIWQGHQEIMSTFAANGNRVLFVENTGVRPPRVRDFPRLRHRIHNWWRGTKGFREERRNLFVYSPVVLPFPYSRLARWFNRTLLVRALRRWMRAADFHAPIVWTFLPTPLARDLMREIDPRLTIYYCIDDLASSSHAARKISRTENKVFREADLVFVTSEQLRKRAAAFSDRVHVFPFGVSYESFERVRLAPNEVPPEIQELRKPVVGYVGGLHQWVDQPLICAIADAMPDASVALIGPPQTDVSALEHRPNIHLFGARPHADLPRYLKGFDVGIVPYRLSEYTAHVYPTKLNEYLAMGMPVVATDLAEIRRFNDKHGSIVATAGDAEGFVTKVREALQGSAPDAVQTRVRVAHENSWTSRIEEMSALIDEALSAKETTPASWELTLGRLYRTARRRTLYACAAVVGIYVLLFYTPALWIAARPLQMSAAPTPADAIVVFGGGVGESGEAGGSYQERVKEAVDLYDAGFARPVIFSSGFVYAFKEPDVMKALAASQGVAAQDILLETHAKSTQENVSFVRDILAAHGWRRILLVSSPYHMRRATLTWRKLAPEITVVPTPAIRSQFYDHGLGASLQQIRGIVHEYAAILYYRWKGWI